MRVNGPGQKVSFAFLLLVLLKEMRARGEPNISYCRFGGKVLPKASASYAKLLGKVAFRVLPNIHGESPPPCPGENNPNDQHPR